MFLGKIRENKKNNKSDLPTLFFLDVTGNTHIFFFWPYSLSVRSGLPNGTNGIPISFKVLPMVPLVIPVVPMVMPMVPLALPMVQLVQLVSQWHH